MAEQEVNSKVSHAATVRIMTDTILLRFQACLKVDNCFFTFENMDFTLGRDLCKMQGVLMDLLIHPVTSV